ncbi:cupin [Niallia circulans]|uniref:cupin domain-containing protein n=1 Tax=Niallia circulans TaxID=1397 RepID=UPI000F45A0DA|nr:cupin domain-containing protein [Niallia circulans]AYV66704.1 cupin [Niallia circulans]
MKLITIGKGKSIEQYNSVSASYCKIMKTDEATNIGIITLGPKGILANHQAPVPQLFHVVEGEGWVRDIDDRKLLIKKGEAVFWEQGEWHETGSDTGLTAFVIQASNLKEPF